MAEVEDGIRMGRLLVKESMSKNAGGRITASEIKIALADDRFTFDHRRKTRFYRSAEVSPGVDVVENRGVRLVKRRKSIEPSGKSTFEVRWYTGIPGNCWKSEAFGTLREAVTKVNEVAAGAEEAVASEQA